MLFQSCLAIRNVLLRQKVVCWPLSFTKLWITHDTPEGTVVSPEVQTEMQRTREGQ